MSKRVSNAKGRPSGNRATHHLRPVPKQPPVSLSVTHALERPSVPQKPSKPKGLINRIRNFFRRSGSRI